MKHVPLKCVAALLTLAVITLPGFARADNAASNGNTECPVGLVSGMTLNQEFGPGTSQITHCIKKRHHVLIAFQLTHFCGDEESTPAACKRAYGLGQMMNVIHDYEITAGMKRGVDYKMIAIAYGDGGRLLLKDNNQFAAEVKALMADGVTFYMCQNTTRGFIRAGLLPNYVTTGIPVETGLIAGTQFVTAGVSAIADHELRGWAVVKP